MQYEIRRIWIHQRESEKSKWEAFLRSANIRPEEAVDFCFGLYSGEQLLATGSLFKNIIKCVAVAEAFQGSEVVGILLSHLINYVFDAGFQSCSIYTTPERAGSFAHFGFEEVAHVPGLLVLLQKPGSAFKEYLKQLAEKRRVGARVAGIVMNANPFTLGHRYLIEYAAQQSDVLHLFVLSEDLSLFPAAVRLKLVEQGCADLPQVCVHPTGEYLVSSTTFPSYFLKEDESVTRAQALLDATLFRDHIAPTLGISARFVGEEPLSPATQLYNSAMQEVFEGRLSLTIIPRKEQGGGVISASRVRALLAEGETERVQELVPPTTFAFLTSEAALPIIQKIKEKAMTHAV